MERLEAVQHDRASLRCIAVSVLLRGGVKEIPPLRREVVAEGLGLCLLVFSGLKSKL